MREEENILRLFEIEPKNNNHSIRVIVVSISGNRSSKWDKRNFENYPHFNERYTLLRNTHGLEH